MEKHKFQAPNSKQYPKTNTDNSLNSMFVILKLRIVWLLLFVI